MHHEQVNATRLIKQLKALLNDMDTLRSQVQYSDVQQFDQLTDQACKDAQDAVKEYLGNSSKDCSLSGSNIGYTIKNQ